MKTDYKAIYIADDGTEFDSEAECKEYEKSLLHTFKGIMLDRDGKPTDYNNAFIVEFTCSEDIASFLKHSISCNDGLDYNSPVGVYLYCANCDRWHLAFPCVQKALTEMFKQTT